MVLNFGVLALARVLVSAGLLFQVAAAAAVVAAALLVLVGLAARVAVVRWRPCVVCPFPS